MRTALVLILLLVACSDKGAVRQDQKVLPNENPTTYYESVPQTEIASTRNIKQALEETRAKQEDLADPDPPPTGILRPEPATVDLRTLTRDDQQERLRQYRTTLMTGNQEEPFSPPKARPDPLTSTAQRATQRPAQPAAKAAPATKPAATRPKGGPLFALPSSATGTLLKPGELFLAQLIGRVSVSSLSPFVLVQIFDARTHAPLGRAIGQATLHPVEKNKALLTFSQIYFNDRTINGRLVGLDMELSEGLRGRLHSGNLRKIMLAFANTFLAALSLQLDTGDTLGQVFQFNFSKSLIDQAQNQIAGLDMARVVTLERGTQFWVMAEAPASVDAKPQFQTNPAFTTAVERAFEQAREKTGLSMERNEQLMDAYRRLSGKLDQLP